VISEPGAAPGAASVLAAVVTGSTHASRSRHQVMTAVKGVVLWWRTIASPWWANNPELTEIRRRTLDNSTASLTNASQVPHTRPVP
jgi:hypothetical protein